MESGPIIFLIVLDTLRHDYGRTHLDKLFQKYGFVRKDAISTACWTAPSHFSIFSGDLPSIHGIGKSKVGKNTSYTDIFSSENIFRYLRALDFKINFFTANPFISKHFGYIDAFFNDYYEVINILARNFFLFSTEELKKISTLQKEGLLGFQRFFSLLKSKKIRLLFKLAYKKAIDYMCLLIPYLALEKGVTNAIKTLRDEITAQPFSFQFFNLMEAHEPYPRLFLSEIRKKISPFRSGLISRFNSLERRWKMGYFLSLSYLRKKLEIFTRLLLKKLKEKDGGKYLIIFTSDHGQMLGEKGVFGHEWGLFDQLIDVPFWIKANDIPSFVKREKRYISLCNIGPFIRSYIDGEKNPWKYLFSDFCFSECFGTATRPPESCPEFLSKYGVYKYRVACKTNEGKVIYNVDDEKVEEKYGKWEECLKKVKEYLENPEEFSPGLFPD